VLTAEVVMRQADYLVLGRDTVKTAIQRIKTKGDMHLYVVDQNHKLVGFLSEQGLLSAEEHHAHAQDLKRYIEHDIPQAGAITPLNELYPLMTDNMPIAVTDEQGCLIGTVHSSDIISNLAMVERIGESVNARKVTGMDVEEEAEEEYETSNNAH
jgi:glycine betaine/proline transport system ATP-binding protein